MQLVQLAKVVTEDPTHVIHFFCAKQLACLSRSASSHTCPPAPILGDPQKLLHAMVHPHRSRRSLHSISHVVDCISAHLLHRKRPRQDALHCSYCARLLSTRVYAEHISDYWNARTSQWREVSPGLPIEPDHLPYFGLVLPVL